MIVFLSCRRQLRSIMGDKQKIAFCQVFWQPLDCALHRQCGSGVQVRRWLWSWIPESEPFSEVTGFSFQAIVHLPGVSDELSLFVVSGASVTTQEESPSFSEGCWGGCHDSLPSCGFRSE